MKNKSTLSKNIKNTKKLFCTSAIALAALTSAIEVNAAVHWSMEAETASGKISDSLVVDGPELILKNGALVSANGNSTTGNSLKLDGVDDYATIAHTNYSFDHTKVRIELAVKADASNDAGYVIERWGQLAVRVRADGIFITAFNANGGATQELFTTSDWDSTQWNHLSIEIVGESLTVFINNVNEGNIALDGGLPASPTKNSLFIGMRYNNSSHFAGYVDEVKIIEDFDAYDPSDADPSLLLPQDKDVGPGSDSTLTVKLSESAVTYPVTVPYQISGDAVTDTTGEIVFSEGTEQSVTLTILADAVAGQTATLTLTSAVNANITDDDAITLTVVEHNVAPQLAVTLTQNNQTISVIDASAGEVTVTANITDINSADLHDVSWTVNNDAFVGIVDDTLLTYTFNPVDLSAGTYGLSVTASENNTADSYTVTVAIDFPVFPELPPLADDVDTDNDGINDSIEGYTDQDNDGILDYLDDDSNTSHLALGAGEQPLQTLTGLKLAVGPFAAAAGGVLTDSATLSAESLTEHALDSSGAPLGNTDDSDYLAVPGATLINFSVSGLEVGMSAPIVYPLMANSTIPEAAVYRKYTPANGWVTFVSDSDNRISSASKDSDGNCPAPSSVSYIDGLTVGDNCIQLEIVDGGIYDADGLSNGVVVDPGLLALEDVPTAPVINMVLAHSVDEGTEYTLDASDTADINVDDILSFSWSQTDGTAVTLTTVDTNTLTFVSPQVGQNGETLSFELQVSDGQLTTTAVITVEVTNVNNAPTIEFDVDSLTVNENVEVRVVAQGSDVDGESLTYKWQQVSGPTATIADDAQAELVFTSPSVVNPQQLTFRLTVSDGDLDTSKDIVISVANLTIELPKMSGGSAFWLMLVAGMVLAGRRKLFSK